MQLKIDGFLISFVNFPYGSTNLRGTGPRGNGLKNLGTQQSLVVAAEKGRSWRCFHEKAEKE